MPVELALKAIENYLDYVICSGSEHAVVCLTGGEPLTCGMNYLSDLLRGIEDIQARTPIPISRDLVTNATLVTSDYVNLFQEHSINLSLSIDGHPNLTNSHRKFRSLQENTADCIARSVDLLRSKHVPFSVLATITASAVGHEAEMLSYLQSLEPRSIAFNPCVDKGPYLDVSAYSLFLLRFFDAWVRSGKYSPGIRTFRYFLQKMTGSLKIDIPCEWNNDCPNTFSISADSKMWVCEMYMGDLNGYLGDVKQQSISEIVDSEPFKTFTSRSKALPDECFTCDAFGCCNGGCANRRVGGKDYLCGATLTLYNHIKGFLDKEVWEPLKTRRDSGLSDV